MARRHSLALPLLQFCANELPKPRARILYRENGLGLVSKKALSWQLSAFSQNENLSRYGFF
jgi:hypothetical protein